MNPLGLVKYWVSNVGYLVCKLGHIVLQAALVVGLFTHLNKDVKVTVFLSQRCNPLILTQIHWEKRIKQQSSSENSSFLQSFDLKALTKRRQQLRAPLAVLHLQAVVALLLLLQGGELRHVATEVEVQQCHQLFTQSAAKLRIGMWVHRTQDELMLAENDSSDPANTP